MFIEMAVADAYAIAWEFTKGQQTAPNDLSQFYQHPTYKELIAGQYTDDTQRSIANAQVLCNPSLSIYDPTSYAQAYLDAYRADPREGYSRGYQAFLNSVTDGHDFLQKVSRTKISNGSVMGVAPLGFLPTVSEVKLAASIQALTTHHPETIVHAQIIALATHFFVHMGGSEHREDLQPWLMGTVDWVDKTDQAYRWSYLVDQFDYGVPTTIKASSISAYMVYAVGLHDSLTGIIQDAVARGGDTDSAAAVAVAVGSLCSEISNDIPVHLVADMDAANPGYGVDFLTDLERDLRMRFIKG